MPQTQFTTPPNFHGPALVEALIALDTAHLIVEGRLTRLNEIRTDHAQTPVSWPLKQVCTQLQDMMQDLLQNAAPRLDGLDTLRLHLALNGADPVAARRIITTLTDR